MKPPVVEVANIVKSYRMGSQRLEVLHGVGLRVDPGGFVSIMGPSGCGKSTLMNLIGCLDRPDSGSIALDGAPVSPLSDEELARIRNRKIGFVFQTFNLLPRFTALENVTIPLLYAGVSRDERRERAADMLTRMGLGDRISHRPSELSGGQLQRVAIARALVNKPSLLLADEPTGNLDSHSGDEIMAIFHRLNESGMTILMVTHNSDLAGETRRIILMKDGQILSDEAAAKGRAS